MIFPLEVMPTGCQSGNHATLHMSGEQPDENDDRQRYAEQDQQT
jgi:hypothetical protein